MVEITFKNRTRSIEKAIIDIDGKKFVFTGEKARELAKMANNDYPTLKNFVEGLMLQNI